MASNLLGPILAPAILSIAKPVTWDSRKLRLNVRFPPWFAGPTTGRNVRNRSVKRPPPERPDRRRRAENGHSICHGRPKRSGWDQRGRLPAQPPPFGMVAPQITFLAGGSF